MKENSNKFTNKQKITFCINYVIKYFLYGYLCITGIIFLMFVTVHIYKNFPFPFNYSAFLLMLFAFPLAGQLGRIIYSTKHKYRYYKISLYRLKTRGFKDEYFKCEMHEPCFRLIIRDLLYKNGYKTEYLALKQNCKGHNFKVEQAEKILLKKVQQKYEKAKKNIGDEL